MLTQPRVPCVPTASLAVGLFLIPSVVHRGGTYSGLSLCAENEKMKKDLDTLKKQSANNNAEYDRLAGEAAKLQV